jgi:hypothetical protein
VVPIIVAAIAIADVTRRATIPCSVTRLRKPTILKTNATRASPAIAVTDDDASAEALARISGPSAATNMLPMNATRANCWRATGARRREVGSIRLSADSWAALKTGGAPASGVRRPCSALFAVRQVHTRPVIDAGIVTFDWPLRPEVESSPHHEHDGNDDGDRPAQPGEDSLRTGVPTRRIVACPGSAR